MFIGHYGVSFAATRFTPRTSLDTLCFPVQLLDGGTAAFAYRALFHDILLAGIGAWVDRRPSA